MKIKFFSVLLLLTLGCEVQPIWGATEAEISRQELSLAARQFTESGTKIGKLLELEFPNSFPEISSKIFSNDIQSIPVAMVQGPLEIQKAPVDAIADPIRKKITVDYGHWREFDLKTKIILVFEQYLDVQSNLSKKDAALLTSRFSALLGLNKQWHKYFSEIGVLSLPSPISGEKGRVQIVISEILESLSKGACVQHGHLPHSKGDEQKPIADLNPKTPNSDISQCEVSYSFEEKWLEGDSSSDHFKLQISDLRKYKGSSKNWGPLLVLFQGQSLITKSSSDLFFKRHQEDHFRIMIGESSYYATRVIDMDSQTEPKFQASFGNVPISNNEFETIFLNLK